MLKNTAFCLLVLLLASTLFAQAKRKKPAASDDAGTCITATSDKDGIGVHAFPGTQKKLYSYNVDIQPAKEHKAMCVSQSRLDSVLWHHGDGTGCFTITPKLISTQNAAGGACPAYPFTRSLPNSCVHMHHTEHARKDAIGCSYDIVFKRENGSATDPHIAIGK